MATKQKRPVTGDVTGLYLFLVRMGRLELPRPKPQPPQGCVSTNSTTSALLGLYY